MNSKPSDRACRAAYSGKRVLVLGSSGFIGRWVARELSKAGAELFLPVRDLAKAKRVFDAFGVGGNIIELDLLDRQGLRSVFDHVRPLITFNLAGYGVDRAEQNEDDAHATNAGLISTICSAIAGTRESNWAGIDIVHAGTAMEYGRISGDLAEDSLPRPTTLYGRSKLAGTKALAEACERLGLKGVTARLFSIYGPGEHPQRLLPSLVRAARSEEVIPLTLGQHKRDFVYVEDVALGMLHLGLSQSFCGQAVNLATGISTPVRAFAEAAADVLRIKRDRLRFGSLPTREEEMEHLPVAIGRLKEMAGWEPQTTIPAGIRATIGFADSPRIEATGKSMDLRGIVYARCTG